MDSETLFIYKYQPLLFKDFEIDDDTIMLLNALMTMDKLNILFIGSAGSGKTSLINAIVSKYYDGAEPRRYAENVLHINSLKEQGVNFYRNEVKTFCQTRSIIKDKKKFIVLDDIDVINEQSQQVFRNCIDKYSGNVHFISSCNNIQKVIESMQSRLTIVKIKPFTSERLHRILKKIKNAENIVMEEEAERFVIRICNNTAKILINYMEKFKLIGKRVTVDLATKVCTNISFDAFEKYTVNVKNKLLTESVDILYEIYDKGYSVMDILDNYSLFVKTTDFLSENDKYSIISCICKYITIFHNTHEEPIELALFTNNVMQMT